MSTALKSLLLVAAFAAIPIAATPVFAMSGSQVLKGCQKSGNCNVIANDSNGTVIVNNINTGVVVACVHGKNCHVTN